MWFGIRIILEGFLGKRWLKFKYERHVEVNEEVFIWGKHKGGKEAKKGLSQEFQLQYSEFQNFDCDLYHEMDMPWNTFSIATQDPIYAYVYIYKTKTLQKILLTLLWYFLLF